MKPNQAIMEKGAAFTNSCFHPLKLLDILNVILILSNDKSLFRGKALIDDRTKYGVTEFEGEHIHFKTERFPNWESVLEYLEC